MLKMMNHAFPARSGAAPSWRMVRAAAASTFLMLIAASMAPLEAQTTGTVVTTAKEVLALPEKAMAGVSARLRGVVVDVSARRDEFSLHDGQTCVSVSMSGSAEAPAPGTEAEVEGAVFAEAFFERRRTRVRAEKVTALGQRTLPEATPVRLQEAANFKHLDQWVSVEGTVLQVRSSMALFTIQMVQEGAACNVLVRDWPRDAIPQDWIGGRVRVSGVNRPYLPGSTFLSVVAAAPAQVEVVKTGVKDPLDAPPATVEALGRRSSTEDTRVKLTGTLLGATSGNVYYARDEQGHGFSFYMLHPIDEDKSGRYSTSITIPQCAPGDVLEVVGLPGKDAPGVHLNFGVARVLRGGPEPAAVPMDIARITAGGHVHDLVEVEGRLLSFDDVLVAPGRWRTTMRLEEAGRRIIVFLDASSRGALAHLEEDHRLRVKGIVTGPPHFPEIRLWVRTAQDLESLGMAQEVETRRLWAGLGVAGVIVILVTGWALLLHRSRQAVAQANLHLEARVAERTAELAAAKEDLSRALDQERELLELKTRFVSLVSHEFRTPLGVTMSAVELLQHYSGQLDEEKRAELLRDIQGATVHMSGLMEQVLLLGRAEAGKMDWRPAPVDLPELCAKAVEENCAATQQRCPVRFSPDGDFSGARMDATLLRHIISNVLSNAVKYSPAGSVVDFRLRREGENAVLTIQDHGIGIPEADRARLFEAFHRASNVGETPGTGLGLLLVKHCVQLHQGSITFDSQEGVGTTFTITLPLGA